MQYTYKTQGTCSTEIQFEIDNGLLHNVRFVRGCDGNLKAISLLVEGKPASEIADLLKGNLCGHRGTSCSDQLAHAIEKAMGK